LRLLLALAWCLSLAMSFFLMMIRSIGICKHDRRLGQPDSEQAPISDNIKSIGP